ncbi:nucleoside diphosphate kinase regulator [Rhodobacteraceae bacterium 2CG4]|uniref:Nucleoside diphosphate kinase regulator n=1 Tax=Halovulum marinum TaxID=2662447 RepID=A0A6L5Z6X9_9RHOB|nr:nucleoside diphosphate kinase regulator [Halovulum marinum]MSU91824.1 nucleoside diphosphate kinase regulator [Halovulum marinum]
MNSIVARSTQKPRIVINADELERLEALAEGALKRNAPLGERLLEEIGRARIVSAKKMPPNVVGIGSTVRYLDNTTGRETSITLVYPEDADIGQQRVSVMTPIGVALLGLAEDASFFWDTVGGQRRTLTVIEVRQTR